MKIALIKERKNPPDKRVVFTPNQCKLIVEKYPALSLQVESSEIRTFSDQEYRDQGIEVTTNIQDCDVFIGVKEVPIEALIPNKKYFFFSHTIKKQSYNRPLLNAILEKNIEFYDHELLTDQKGNRVVAFGKYAGIVGAYNGFRAWALKNNIKFPKAEHCKDQQELIHHLKTLHLPALKIIVTGRGRVSSGIREILEGMQLKEVSIEAYLQETFSEPVFCQISGLDYQKRKDGELLTKDNLYQHPLEYESDFFKFSKVSDILITGHFYADDAPIILSQKELASKQNRIKIIADVSCDINGPIAATIKASTIENPIYGYDPKTGNEVSFKDANAIVVMAVDNLPCELPQDASKGFGSMFEKYVLPALLNEDPEGVLERAKMTYNEKLTPRYAFLQDYVDGK